MGGSPLADTPFMTVAVPSRRPWAVRWAAVWVLAVAWQVGSATLGGTRAFGANPHLLFWIVVIAASLCVVASLVVIAVAWRSDLAELGVLGAFGIAVSALPLVHGLTVPGVLYGANDATLSSVLWALPVASVVALPVVFSSSSWARTLLRQWKLWSVGCSAAAVAVALALLVNTSLLPAPRMGAVGSVVFGAVSLAACVVLSLRHLRLAWIGNSPRPLWVAAGFSLVGASNLVWLARAPFTIGFWSAHVFDIVGVFALAFGSLHAYRQRADLRALIAPLATNEPLAAFELGLDPLVHRFVALIERKDVITRDHVVRTAELAIDLGLHLGWHPTEVHRVGLAALLHDVGKLSIPDAILQKPSKLTVAEYELIKTHAESGAVLLAGSPGLQDIAGIVRSHHERPDGNGYPSGLIGDELPLLARAVSVCDGYDAMAFSRQYRDGMGRERAIDVLREHAGRQWDAAMVEALTATLATRRVRTATLAHVGHAAGLADVGCVSCTDAMPPGLAAAG